MNESCSISQEDDLAFTCIMSCLEGHTVLFFLLLIGMKHYSCVNRNGIMDYKVFKTETKE